PEYRLLRETQIKRIHCATLELMETSGVKVMDDDALEMLSESGCRIKSDNIVQFPNWLVEDCIRSAPSRITIYNRLGEEAMRLEGNRIHFGLGTDLVNTYDLDTGELRQSQLKDVGRAAKVADALQEIDFIGSYALPYDSPRNMGYVDSFKVQLENSVKPIFYTAAGPEDLAIINNMAAAAVGGTDILREKPISIHYSEPLTPLSHSSGAIKKLFYCADNLIPLNYTPGMMSGGTAPITLAGAITVGNAEALSGLVMHQLRCKGAPIISGFGMSTLDMKTAACIYACPEYRLALSACADLYHYYGIPMWGTAGVSDAQCLDEQAGMEWGISLLTAALDGANLIHDVGYLGQGLIGHPAAIVICAEIISYVKRFIRGFTIDDADISMDVIRKVGPQGQFLSTPHTVKNFKKEHWLPELSNRFPLAYWKASGQQSLADKAIDRAKMILKDHQVTPLDGGIQETLDAMRSAAVEELEGISFET
ncbi:MAG: trimethylamine methyltransferase family protein, partial [Deltaproteobacteria bacterium]|nr:trimethylamine methyltransferase family protein [Deltaproteobacteria bacterium]